MTNKIVNYRPDSYLSFFIKRHFAGVIFIFLVVFTAFPLVVLTTKANYQNLSSTYIYFDICAFVLLLCAFIYPLGFFNFLNRKSTGDIYFSLPIKKQKLFFYNYLLGLFNTILPVSVAVFLGLWALDIKGSPYFWINLLIYGKILFFYFVIYNFNVLVIQKCNNLLDGFIASIIMINLPVSMYYSVIVFLETTLLGFPYYSNHNLITILSPIFSLFNSWRSTTSLWLYLIDSLLLIILPILASIAFYSRKPEQSAGASISHLIYPLINYVSVFIVFMLSLVIAAEISLSIITKYIFAIFCALLTTLFIRVLKSRGFKSFTKSLKIFIPYILTIVLIVATCEISGGYGYVQFLPETSSVTSLEVSENFFIQLFNDPINRNNQTVETSDYLIINKFIELQESLIRKSHMTTKYNLILNLTYQRVIFNYKRRYRVPTNLLTYDFYYSIIEQELWLPNYQRLFYEKNDWILLSIDDALKTSGFKIFNDTNKTTQLIEAIKSDILNLNAISLYQKEGLPLCNLHFYDLTYQNDFYVPIYSDFKETCLLLENFSYTIPAINLDLVTSVSIGELNDRPYYFTLYNQNLKELINIQDLEPKQWNYYFSNMTPFLLSDSKYRVVIITLVDDSQLIFATTK